MRRPDWLSTRGRNASLAAAPDRRSSDRVVRRAGRCVVRLLPLLLQRHAPRLSRVMTVAGSHVGLHVLPFRLPARLAPRAPPSPPAPPPRRPPIPRPRGPAAGAATFDGRSIWRTTGSTRW